ncbi:MAG: succinylglutamate desuccinylase/aspartoacylase family protein, partial [Candidatus Nanohaloarchaea archaeon]|nr:succinylglutamate desuccinylase/aspartoacylase family protein [Candidatus Nanohaloarchaea archaeon]
MQVIDRGTGTPELVVIGSIHGDEPAGRDAIRRILDSNHTYQKPVRFIVANEEALEADERFLEADLNRSFPGNSDSEKHEERLAARLLEAIGDARVLDIHTTHSHPKPFGTAKDTDTGTMEMARASGVDHLVIFPEGSGALTEFVDGLLVETGLQGTDQAVQNAVEVIERVLGFYGIIEHDVDPGDPEIYRYYET